MQLSFKRAGRPRRNSASAPEKLSELHEGEVGIIERIELPEAITQRLMELGFLPGNSVTAARSAPGGDPRVFRVDGAEVALRRETAHHLFLKR
jgi:ferrous iron transport protein A